MLFDYKAVRTFIEEAAAHYDKSAPALVSWLDDTYIALAENPRAVSVWEIMQLQKLRTDGVWEHPNYAQNRWYKVRAELGQDRGVISY